MKAQGATNIGRILGIRIYDLAKQTIKNRRNLIYIYIYMTHVMNVNGIEMSIHEYIVMRLVAFGDWDKAVS